MRMTSALWVRTWIRYAPLLPILCFCMPSNMFSNCLRELNYSILETRSHAIEQGVDITTLPTKDLLKGKGETIYYDINLCIDQSGFITRTTTRLTTEDTFYPSAIHTIVYDQSGTHSYSKDGSLVSSVAHKKAFGQDIPGVDFALTSGQISNFGLNYDFSNIIADFNTHFTSLGGTIWSEGSKEYFSSPEFEVVVSADNLYYLTNKYHQGGAIDFIHLKTFTSRGGLIIPEFDIKHVYSDISQGKLQTTTNKVYLSYEVWDNGQPVVQYTSSDQAYKEKEFRGSNSNMSFSRFALPERLTPAVKLYPNPSSDFLNVNFKNHFRAQDVSWQINNISNVQVRSGLKSAVEPEIEISVQDLPSGIYYMHLKAEEHTYLQKFIITK